MKIITLALALLPFSLSLNSFAKENPNKILVVVSEANYIQLKNGNKHPTGYYLSELMVPVSAILKSGYEVTFATPTGKTPTMDASSDSDQYFKNKEEHIELKKLHDSLKNLKHPKSLKNMSENDFSSFEGIFFPGGHAPMTDLVNSPETGRVLKHFHKYEKPTALICHGPAALLSTRNPGEGWIYSGYKMISFTNEEEKVAEANFLKGDVLFYLEDELKKYGANFIQSKAWASKSVWDRELITGQNPMSDRLLVDDFLSALVVDKFAKNINIEKSSKFDVIPFNINSKAGFTYVYVGAKKKNIDEKVFKDKLMKHLSTVKETFQPMGLNGYKVYSNGNNEFALMNWESKEAADLANKSAKAEVIFKEAAEILDSVVWTPLI